MAIPGSSHAASPSARIVSIDDLRAHCSSCSMRELCLPFGLGSGEIEQLFAIIGSRVKLRKGEALFRNGAAFSALFAIRLGSMKTTMLSDDGREQIAGYHMPGDILGLDGISSGRHECEAIALEDTETCLIPFERLEEVAREIPALQHSLHRVVGREIGQDHRQLLLLGSMRAEERLAAFLLSLSERYRRRGYSSTEFVLRMTREEIGSFLGLKLETVSRLFSRFQEEGLVQVQGRAVKIVDLPTLKKLAGVH
ncbi:MAG: fumarate/nitrate reduction transcriptional regulator Fnr [Burkholderiales bacterium]|nr:fumarate/nitrate reduction transcriptional regulator Fnr [Burkholderiales bacterium]